MDYLDFELEIGLGQGNQYPVAVIRSPAGGQARETMLFPFDGLVLENRLLALQNALLRSGGQLRQDPTTDEQIIQNFGNDLFKAVFTGEILNRYDSSRTRAKDQRKGLRLKLLLQSPKMAALPWEFLFDHRRGEYLGRSENTPIIRYLDLDQPILSLKVTPPLRLLGMIASPGGLSALDAAHEQERIQTAVKDLHAKGFIELNWLQGQTWLDLQKAMWHGPWHIFHFIGHSEFDSRTNQGFIALADENGHKHLLNATQVADLLVSHHDLRLVILNSCEGAKGGNLDIYSSTAATLLRRGIAAVLAMQCRISDRAAIEFSRSFYQALANGLPIDAAVSSARIAVNIEVENSLEWGAPVLYMGSPDGVLFEIKDDYRKSRLWVNTEPQGASIQFLNFQAEFSQGMEIDPGRYDIEFSAAGYETKTKVVDLRAGEEKHLTIHLTHIPIKRRWLGLEIKFIISFGVPLVLLFILLFRPSLSPTPTEGLIGYKPPPTSEKITTGSIKLQKTTPPNQYVVTGTIEPNSADKNVWFVILSDQRVKWLLELSQADKQKRAFEKSVIMPEGIKSGALVLLEAGPKSQEALRRCMNPQEHVELTVEQLKDAREVARREFTTN